MTAALVPYGPVLAAPFRQKTYGPTPQRSVMLAMRRWRIESTFDQLVERYQLKQVLARDLWQFANRLVRKVLIHTIAMHLNAPAARPPAHLKTQITLRNDIPIGIWTWLVFHHPGQCLWRVRCATFFLHKAQKYVKLRTPYGAPSLHHGHEIQNGHLRARVGKAPY